MRSEWTTLASKLFSFLKSELTATYNLDLSTVEYAESYLYKSPVGLLDSSNRLGYKLPSETLPPPLLKLLSYLYAKLNLL